MDKKTFSRMALIQASLLALLFVLGTGLADFTFVPLLNSPQTISVLTLLVHIALGFIITALSIALYIASRRLKSFRETAEKASLTGFVFVLVSLISGIALVSGSNNAFFEYVMSLGFIVAFGIYLFLIGKMR